MLTVPNFTIQKEVKKSAIFANAEIVGYRNDNDQKDNSSENLKKGISNKRFTADDHPEETIKSGNIN